MCFINNYCCLHYFSSYTPSASPTSLDLDETSDNAATNPSNTKKTVEPSSTFPQCTAAVLPPPPLSTAPRRDLHSDVINLNRRGEPPDQSVPPSRSRDCLFQHCGTGAFVSLPSLASSLTDGEYDPVTSCYGQFSGESSMQGGSGSAGGTQNQSGNALTVIGIENGLKSIPADSSLNAANIVGLPSSRGARYTSVPCGGTSANFQQNAHAVTRSPNGGSYPQHFRNISEPSQQILRYPNNAGQVVPLLHQNPHASTGANSQIDQHNLQLINHFRSSSVPKSMTLISKYDVTASSGPPGSVRVKGMQVLPQATGPSYAMPNTGSVRVATTKPSISNISVPSSLATSPIKNVQPQNTGNVSNVNVNFYRAVPVNVVSSVPTIHCLNTLSNDQGNSVSNVQVLPLGSSTQTGSAQISIDANQRSFNDEVTVHNVRIPQIPSVRGTQHPTLITPINPVPVTTSTKTHVSIQSVFASEVPVQLSGRIITTTAQINSHSHPPVSQPPSIVRTRTFTSTEAQTDEILPVTVPNATQNAREQRRRERRERRQNRRNHGQRATNDTSTQAGNGSIQPSGEQQQENRLPDILNSHLPPPYSTLPNAQAASMMPPPQILPPPPPIIPGAMLPNPPGPVLQTVVPNGVPASAFVFPAPQQMAPLMQGGAPVPVAVPATAPTGFRFGFPANGFRR